MARRPYVGHTKNIGGSNNECLVNNESVGHSTESRGLSWRGQQPISTRFWSKVNKEGSVHPVIGTSCWLWTGLVVARYGQISLGHPSTPGAKRWKAHRFSWELHNGPIPEGLRVLHICDNCLCVRPDHLRLGTQRENVHDSIRKGRRNAFGHQKLQADDVRIIRSQAERGIPVEDIASAFSIAPRTVRGILRGETWRHAKESVPADALAEGEKSSLHVR